MGSFTNTVLLGVGIGLLLAPRSGKETRSFLVQRFQYLRGIPPENEELKQQVRQMSDRVQDVQQKANQAAQMGSEVQNYAQETAKSVNSVQNDLSNVAQQTGTDTTATRPARPGQQNRSGRQGS
jgi:gas vesicle protein